MATPDLAPDLSHPEPDPEPPAPSTPAPVAIADGVERRLDPRVIQLDRIVGWITTASIALGSLAALTVLFLVADNIPGWLKVLFLVLWVMVTLVLAWSSHRWPEVEHRHTSYKVDERGIEIRKGVLWRQVIHVPRSRVQHTDVSQGPIERGFGLGTLVIYTAGTAHARVDLPGLEHSTALQIRDYLLPDDEDAG